MSNKKEIERAIAEIEKIYPPDDLISNYKDFLKHRDFLHFYQYNKNVFISLIDLAYNLWFINERINRKSLIIVTKRYFKKAKTKSDLPFETSRKIFKLFQEIVYKKRLKLSEYTIEEMNNAINSIIIGIKLTKEEIQWLCNHTNNSKFILNRVLRYHLKSDIISNWAEKNYEKDFAKSRRSEITSWIIDKKPDFKIDKEIIKLDFEFQILEDKRLVEKYKKSIMSYKASKNKIIYINYKEISSIFGGDENEFKFKTLEKPTLITKRRNFNYYIKTGLNNEEDIPDFKLTSKNFYDNFNLNYKKVMAWSIAYSRLTINQKVKLLNDYFTIEIYPTFFSIGKRLKSVEYFNWLKLIAL